MGDLLGISSSCRKGSNSTLLLERALGGAEEAGASVDRIDVSRSRIEPCSACDACRKTGRCVRRNDELCDLLDRIMSFDRVLVAMPVYYMAVPAQLKLLIDRTQCLYNRKYVMKDVLPAEALARRRGGVIAVAGSRFKRAFEGIDLTMRFFFDSLQMQFAEKLYVGHVDAERAILEHPEQLDAAAELGRRMAGG